MNKFKKAAVSLALVAAISLPISASTFAADYLGDVNDDGNVNSSDALAVLNYAVGNESEGFLLERADLNGDGNVNSSDALKILEISVGLAEKTEIVTEKTPLDFDTAEIVEYYNSALKNTYASENVTIAKNVGFDSIKLEKFSPASFKGTVQGLIDGLAKPSAETQTFNGDAAAAEAFLVPTALESDGAKSASIEATEQGYKVTITLVEEKVNYKTAPKYNTQASLPITGLTDLVAENNVTIKSSSLDYVGTVITAELDSEGKLLSLNHTIPLKVQAEGNYSLVSISAKGSGTYLLDATFTY